MSKNVIRGINWNNPEDSYDVQVYDQLVSQFWIPDRFPISNDLKSWATLSAEEKWLTMQVFTGLTVLDTLQGDLGAVSLLADAQTDQERAWLANIHFMETIHAKSYSSIFMTLSSSKETDRAFKWSEDNDWLQYKARICAEFYHGIKGTPKVLIPLQRKVASVLLESFLFYSGFYLPLYWQSIGKLNNTADMIKAIIRDEAVHGAAIGYKYQVGLEKLSDSDKNLMSEFTYDLLDNLYDNEAKYTQELYDAHGLTEDVKKFLRYNGNRALMNLGYDPLFPREEVNPAILTGLSLSAVTTDFFSGTGAYAIAKVEEVDDGMFEDWED